MAKKTKGKQKTDEISAGKNVGSNTAPAPEPTVMSAAVTEIDFRPDPPMERQAAAWGTDSGGWGTQEAQAAGDTWGTRHESEEAWGDHPESLLQPPPPQSHGILPTIPEHSSPGGQSSQIRRPLSDIGESQQSRDDYDSGSWSGHEDLPAHPYAEGQQSQTLTATAAPSAMGSPAPHPTISLTEAASRAHAQSLVGQKLSSASEAARKLEESRGRLNVYPTNTNTNSIGVSPAMRYEPLKDHSNHAPGAPMSSASAAAALLESTSNRLRAQGHGTSKPPQPTATAPPGKTAWTYPKPVVPNGRPAAAIPPDASWTMTGGNTWSNKHRQTKSANVHWGQENENAWNQQIPQRGQQHQHQQHQQHPQAHQGHQRPQHSKHHSHPGHPTHQQRPQPGQSQSWQGWGKDGWDQEEPSETETEETADAWGQHGGDGWGQSGGDNWGQQTGGWGQQQQQQQHRQKGRGGGKSDRGRGRGGTKHPDDGWGGGQADGWGQQGGWDQGEGGTWGQSNDDWSGQGRGGQGQGGQGQGHGRGHAPSDSGWVQEDNDWGQQQDSGWGKTADGGWSKTVDGGWGNTADASGKPADDGWGKPTDTGWGAGGEWGAGGRAQSNSEWGAGPQSKETAASRAQVSEQQKAQILNSMLSQGQNQKGPSNATTAQLQAMQQNATQLQAHLAALQSAIAQGQKSGMSAAQLLTTQQQAAQTQAQLAMVLGAMGQNQKNGNMTTAQHQAAQMQAAQLQAQLAATQGAKLHPKAKPQENRDVWEAYDADNGWGSVDSSDDEYDPNRRVHFSPKASDLWGGSPRSVPSKTLVQAQQQQGIATTPLNLTSNVRFVESRGAAFAFVSNAFFGNSRFARERIHWMFPANKDERVANMLAWVQKMSFNLATFGLIKFLETRERGALFVNAVFRMHQHPNEPAFDWLTFNQLQGTMDKTLQESTAFYDPARLVTVFVYLPSQSGNSVAIWRRKINVPDSARLKYQAEINAVVRNLRSEKDYVVMVDELPKVKPKTPQKPGQLRKSLKAIPAKTGAKSKSTSKDAQKTQKKRKWWKFFLS